MQFARATDHLKFEMLRQLELRPCARTAVKKSEVPMHYLWRVRARGDVDEDT